jgi:hippurate hydrolase
MRQKLLSIAISASLLISTVPALAADNDLTKTISNDYQTYLGPLFKHFHANPELSTVENKTAARMAT